MKKIFILSFLLFSAKFLFAQYTPSIHQEELEFYNAENKTTQWYEENVNTEIYDFEKSRSSCNLNKVVYGWHPYWIGSAYNNYDWDLLSHFSFFSYEVNENNGNPLSTHGWATSVAVDSALAKGVKVTLCVTLFGGTKLTTFLTNSTAKQTLIDNLINLVQSRGAHGVNIDFEGLPFSQKTNFANFMVDLCNQMHTAIPGSEVSTVLYAVDWNNVFDFDIMEPHVDHYIVMGYAYYYQGSSNTGPCDPLYHFGSTYNYTLSRTTTYYLNKGCPKEKFILGLPYYGYEWPTASLSIPSATTGSGTARTFANVKNNVSGNYSAANHTWDVDSYTNIYAFNDGGTNKQCFITLEEAFRARLALVNQTGIGGIGIWALGYDNGYNQLWNAIEDYLTDCYQDPCSGNVFDFGGPTKNYYNNENYTWTISPPGASYLNLDFSSFSVEVGYDTLFIYDGSTTAAPLIGSYTGNVSPGTFSTSTNAITFYWKSDGATVGAGWNASYNCVFSTTNPIADFNLPANSTICQGETVQFINTSVDASSYYWEFENGFPATSTNTNPTITYFTSGTYNVKLNAIDGLDTNTINQTITVNIANAPLSNFTTNSPVYLPFSTIYFTNSSSNAMSYIWNFGDGTSTTDANPWKNYGTAGTYTVTLIAKNFICSDDTTTQIVEIIDNVGIDDYTSELFSIYPNPFNNEIWISGELAANTKIILMDASGKIIYQEDNFDFNLMKFSDLENLANGMYFIEIIQDNTSFRYKLMKQ